MTTTDRTDRRYLARLAYHLQARQMPADRIDDILDEARAHVGHTGETLDEAFGPPGDYARRWVVPARPRRWPQVVASAAVSVLGTATLTIGATRFADDAASRSGAVWLVLAGALMVVGTAAVAPIARLRDPVGGCYRGASRRTVVAFALLACAIIAAAGVLGAVF